MSVFEADREGDIDKLVDLLQNSESEEVRRHVADTLGEVDSPEGAAVDALISAALDDTEPSVRSAAVDALDEIGSEATERLLVRMADVDLDPEASTWSRVDAFSEALTDDRPAIRMAAASALGRSDEPAAVDALVDCLDDPEPAVRARVARACGRLGDDRCTSPLCGLVDDGNPEVRREVAEALGATGGEDGEEALESLVEDSSVAVRRSAVSSLGTFGTEDALDQLIEALSDQADVVRRTAVYSIIELLSNAPPDRSDALRNAVVERLSAVDDREVLLPMVEILREGSAVRQRRNTAWLLGRIAGEEQAGAAVTALVEALEDDDKLVAQFAATGLSTLGGPAVEDALISVLDDDGASIRANAMAAFALGDVGGERARERLGELVDESDNEDVRRRAFAALSSLGGR